jgi:hypothetical protein
MKIIKVAMPARRIKDEAKNGWKIETSLNPTPNFGEDTYLRVDLIKIGKDGFSEFVEVQGNEVEAGLHAMKVGENNGCPIWTVFDCIAPHGFGPMLYDEAMKYVSSINGYLISNSEAKRIFGTQGNTSEEAQRIWDHYRDKRDDVEYFEGLGFQYKRDENNI